MRIAKGILTAFGGASSHAALVSRQMGKVCIVGCGSLDIDYHKETITVGGKTLKPGDWISIDGFSGEVYEGKVATKPSEVVEVLLTKTKKPEESETYQRYAQLMTWVDKHRKLRVRTNADQPDQAARAVSFGSEGIGLCRTEHMFFEHLDEIREMIVADTGRRREKALAKLLPLPAQRLCRPVPRDEGRPVTIRLLDPPLHEFLSEHHLHEQPDLAEKLAKSLGVAKDDRSSPRGRAEGDEPDAGPSRLPAGNRLSRDHRDAGPGHF